MGLWTSKSNKKEPPQIEAPRSALEKLPSHVQRLVAQNTERREEDAALEVLAKTAFENAFLTELAYRGAVGVDEVELLQGAKVKVGRHYEDGPKPKWAIAFSIPANYGPGIGAAGGRITRRENELKPVLKSLHESFSAALGANQKGRTSFMKESHMAADDDAPVHRLHSGARDELDEIADAFNKIITAPDATKINMAELRAAARAEAKEKMQQKGIDLGM